MERGLSVAAAHITRRVRVIATEFRHVIPPTIFFAVRFNLVYPITSKPWPGTSQDRQAVLNPDQGKAAIDSS